jgi:(+)-trans-carveol dehydrogenase
MGRVDGKVAFITGAARGQGRSHAMRLAAEGADIIAVDSLTDYDRDAVHYEMSDQSDMDETVRFVEKEGRRILPIKADVRSFEQMRAAVAEGLAAFGHVDIVCANAGVGVIGAPFWQTSEAKWDVTIDVNLKGVWVTCAAVAPSMIEHGTGGSIIVTLSGSAMKAIPNGVAYTSSKFGALGLMKTMANELAEHYIRVNAVLPAAVNTKMIHNDTLYGLFRPDLEHPGPDDIKELMQRGNAMPEPWLESSDISNAVLWLASDEARFVTGVALPVDLGNLNKTVEMVASPHG